MAQVFYGRRYTAATDRADSFASGTAYAQDTGIITASQDGRIIAIAGWLGASSGSTTGRWSVYTNQAGSNTPNLLMGNTDLATIPNTWTAGTGGQNFQRSVVSVETGFGASELGVLVRQGDRLHLTWQASGTTRHGYSNVTGKTRSNRLIAGTTPPNPFAFTSRTNNGHEYAWFAVVEQNRAPVLTNLAPDNIITNTLNPIFSFRFTDADRAAGYNDYPTRAIIRVYENVSGAFVFKGAHTEVLPNPGPGTSFVDVSFDYQGAALTMEKSYVWTLEVQDEIGGTSGTTFAGVIAGTTTPDGSLTFDLSTKGDLVPTGPTGKQTTLTPGPFTGTYTHPGASDLDKVRLRLLKRNNLGQYLVVQTSALLDIANVASGSPVSVSFATAGFSALAWSESYAVEWELTAADASVSDWVGQRLFSTNKLPEQPLVTSPLSGEFFATLPELFAYVFDEDDLPTGSLTAEYEITAPYVIANPGFETNLTGWTYSESGAFTEAVTRNTTAPISGVADGQIVISVAPGNTTSTFDYTNSDQQPCSPGYTYSADASFKRSNTSVTGALVLKWFTAGAVAISESVGSFITPSAGVAAALLVSGVAPATAAYFQVALRAKNTTSSPTVPYTVNADSFRVYDGVRYLRSGTHVGNNIYRYSTISADIPVDGTVTVRARGKDANNSGPWSPYALFTKASGIAGTITSPVAAAVLASSAIPVAWTVDSGGPQTRYRVDVVDADTGENLYDSLWVVSTDTAFTAPPGYIGGSGSFLIRLSLDNGAISSVVDTVNISTSYVAPAAPANFNAAIYQHTDEPEASSVMLSWDAVDTDPANLERLEIWADDGDGNKRIASYEGGVGANITDFLYPFPRSGKEIEFSIRQIVQQNTGAIQHGLWAQAYARVDLTALYMVSTVSPMDRRLATRYWQEGSVTLTHTQQWSTPAAALDYVEVPSSLRGRDLAYTVEFIDHQDESGITAQQDQDTFEQLFDGILSSDGSRRTSDVLCFRDPRGYKHFSRFNGNPSVRHGKGGVRYADTFALRRVSFVEGV